MTHYAKEKLARFGHYLSLVSGVLCAAVGLLLLPWLVSLFLLGVIIVLTAVLQRMTFKTLASGLTVLFSIAYLVLWWLATGGLSIVFGLQYVGVLGALLGILGGSISTVAVRTL